MEDRTRSSIIRAKTYEIRQAEAQLTAQIEELEDQIYRLRYYRGLCYGMIGALSVVVALNFEAHMLDPWFALLLLSGAFNALLIIQAFIREAAKKLGRKQWDLRKLR